MSKNTKLLLGFYGSLILSILFIFLAKLSLVNTHNSLLFLLCFTIATFSILTFFTILDNLKEIVLLHKPIYTFIKNMTKFFLNI